MKTLIAKQKRLFVVLGLVLTVPVLLQTWWLTARVRGRLDAQIDLGRGHYAIHAYGLNLSRREYARIVKDRYGIETHVDAFYIVSELQIAFADSYDKLTTDAAKRRFGHDVSKECSEEARREWEIRRARMPGNK
jgi:hypothetical protein